MRFEKGNKISSGRPKGTQNKLTVSVKEAFAEAFKKLGGAKALAEWGMKNPTEFYKLASKLIPTDLNLAVKEMPEARVYPTQPIDESRLPPPSEAMDSLH